MGTSDGDTHVRFYLLALVCSPIISAGAAGYLCLFLRLTNFWEAFFLIYMLTQIILITGITLNALDNIR